MQAIILAAGMGKRLKELTRSNTKCMVEVNGVTLIDRLLHQLEGHDLSRIIVVVGYEGQKLMDYIGTLNIKTPIVYVKNEIYDKTNNIYSLALAKDYLCQEDTLLFESDLILEDSIIDLLVSDERETLTLVDKYESWMDGTCVVLSEDDTIEAFVPRSNFDYDEKDRYYKTVNIYKFSREFSKTYYVPYMEAYCSAMGENEYYEQVLRVITLLDESAIKAKRLDGQRWYEIDDVQDLEIASTLFATGAMRKERIGQMYGGYWRYPKMLDYCYLVNPYYPPKKLMEEMKASFDMLLTSYPSGMRSNALLAAKNFGIHRDNVVVGNGASELIKCLMDCYGQQGACVTGVLRPTFEEYSNRCEKVVSYTPKNPDYSYGAEDIIEYFRDKEIDNFVLINPDNPSGNYISRADIDKLIEWSDKRNINFVVDESFVDFADEENATLLTQDVLEKNPHMVVVKSISKSYGVPGLRLGVMASGDRELIEKLQKEAAIWNINSLAEFYMQIAEKYKKNYECGLEKFREERKYFEKALRDIKGLRVIPSQANYFMLELTDVRITARELTIRLLERHNIYIKDLTGKFDGGDRYIRIAVRDREDNNRLVEALRTELLQIYI